VGEYDRTYPTAIRQTVFFENHEWLAESPDGYSLQKARAAQLAHLWAFPEAEA
jgi:hypothetical protein